LLEIAYMYYDWPCINHHLIAHMYSSLWTELHSSLFPLSSTLFTRLSELGSISNHGGQGELVTTAAIGKEKKARSVRGGLCCMQLQMKCCPLVCSLP